MNDNPFAEIFQPYFRWLKDLLGNLAREASRHNVSPGAIAKDFLSLPRRRNSVLSNLDSYDAFIIDFWQTNHARVDALLSTQHGFKARFGGDIGPHWQDHLFERVGVYFDTVVVPDPMLRIARLPDVMQQKEYYFLKYGIEQILLESVYLANVNPPLAVLVADHELMGETPNFQELSKIGELDSTLLTNWLYDVDLQDFDQARAFFGRFKSAKEAIEESAHPEVFFFAEDVPREKTVQLEALIKDSRLTSDENSLGMKFDSPEFLLSILMGRMMQSNDVLGRAQAQSAHPLMTAEVSFHWLATKIKLNQQFLSQELNTKAIWELNKTNALLSQNLEWMSNIPLEALIGLRKKGQLKELRSLINQEMHLLSEASLDNAGEVASQVDYNLATALVTHQAKLKALDEKYRTELAISGGTMLASIIAAFQPSIAAILPGWLPAIGGLIGVSKLKDVVKAGIGYYRGRKELRKSPVGILWEAKKKQS